MPPDHERRTAFTPEQRLLILDAWQRSGLPAADFAPLVGLSRHTLYAWKQRFEQHGPAGLLDQPLGAPAGSRLPELTKRTILLLKQAHPDWGCQKLSDMLRRGPALPASPSAVARVLREAGYTTEDKPAPGPHEPPVHRFERARPNQLWQTDKQRKEVELAAPPAAAALPEAVSPTANLEDGPAGEDAEGGPGESALDEQVERLRRQGLLEEEGGQP